MPAVVNRGKTRSSRLSSPKPRVSAQKKTPSTSSEWVEPPVKDARPSYEEHGAHMSVLEDMQALGQPPNAKVRNRVKEQAPRKTLGRHQKVAQDYGLAVAPQSALDTPEPPTVIEQDKATAGHPATDENADPAATIEGDEAAKTRGSRRSARSRRNRASSAASETVKIPSPTPEITQPASENDATSTDIAMPSATNDVSEDDVEQANFRIVVQIAEDRARELGFGLFADALKKVYNDSTDNRQYAHLLRAVLLQSDTSNERVQFHNMITKAKESLQPKNDATRNGQQNGVDRSHSPAASPQSVTNARPSIETAPAPKVPKLRLSLKGNKLTGTAIDSTQEKAGRRSTRIRISNVRSASPAVSSTSDETEAIITASRADIDRATSTSSRGSLRPNGLLDHSRLHPNSSLSRNSRAAAAQADNASEVSDVARSDSAELLPTVEDDYVMEDAQTADRPLKRSPAVAGLDADGLQRIEDSKRRKFMDTLYQDPGPTVQYDQSHIRQSTESRAPQIATPTITITNGHVHGRSRRAASESSLSDMSSTPPLEDSFAEMQALKGMRKAKTKQSPMKKQALAPGDAEGRAGPGMDNIDKNFDDEESDHSDTCNACGGRGQLVCCDGCDRAYHYVCVDPPLTEDSPALLEAWYCPSCEVRRKPTARQPRGLFSALLQGLDKKNPTIFALPTELQQYYANTIVGKDGNLEIGTGQKTRNTRGGYDEVLDLFKTRDTKGQAIICYHCARSAEGQREIITCDVCANHWHLDCTSPPLVTPPHRDPHGRKTKDWICPLHVDHDLSAIDPMRLATRRKIRLRKPKVPKIVDTSLRRGLVNNGIIEVIDESSSSEESEYEDDATVNTDETGIIYRVSAQGVKLDFIDKVHRVRASEATHLAPPLPPPHRTRITSRVLNAHLNARPVHERHAALSLSQLSAADLDSGDKVQDLINTLTVEASGAVLGQVAADEKAEDKQARRRRLLELQELIRRKLEEE